MKHYLHVVALSTCIFIILACVSCVSPENSVEAQWRLVQEKIVHAWCDPKSLFGIGKCYAALVNPAFLGESEIVDTDKPCEGAAGSVIPPLYQYCMMDSIEEFWGWKHQYKHVSIAGIEHYWVKQGKDDCWAAALYTAREFLRLFHISKDDLHSEPFKQCPNLANSTRKTRDLYQIIVAIKTLKQTYDGERVNLRFCINIDCIVESLRNQRPVIMMLNGDHAVLVIGMDYYDSNRFRETLITMENIRYLPKMLQILDPRQEGPQPKIDNMTVKEFCGADAFITF